MIIRTEFPMKVLVDEQVRFLLEALEATIKPHAEHEWATTAELCNHFGIDLSRSGRDNDKYIDTFHEFPHGNDTQWFIRIDYIPWWLFKHVSNHAKRSQEKKEKEKRIVDFLNRIGILIPKVDNYVYFWQIKRTGHIKVGQTIDIKDRKQRVKKNLNSEIKELKKILIDESYSATTEEQGIKSHFSHLTLSPDEYSQYYKGKIQYKGEIFKPAEELMVFIEIYKGP